MVKMDYKLKVTYLGLLMLYLTIDWTSCLDNGLALTPPMGWLSWERYRCNIDCDNDPDNCISEKLYMRMADLLVSKGYKDKGYVYVNIDDCWMEKQRDSNGSLVPDRQRFPHGIKWLADYVHSKGLKLGIYEDMGTYTCEGYPGSEFYLQQDAETFASWGIDSVKLDGCNSAISDLAFGYTAMSKFMNRTGRPMLYSCSWPAYVVFDGKIPDYKNIADNCNLWRNYRDIEDSWDSVSDIIQYYGNDTGNFSMVAGPGNFNDPDMLILGDYSLSYDQQKVQMAMWAIMASPLYISADLANIQPQAQALLQNDNIIKINQDPLGIQGRRIMKNGDVEIWTKTLVNKGMAFAFLNHNQYGGPVKVTVTISSLGLNAPFGYNIVEGFSGNSTGTFRPQDNFTMQVDPSGVWLGIASVSP